MITINRNNYEEYFLLYADGELDAATKCEVENFVLQNSDLAVELDMLMQTKSLPEQIVFNDKDLLLRTEGNNINETNYAEYFLLYIDNELSDFKRKEVEKYVLQHPKLQDEFTTLKQAVLTPEVISYGDKKDLYRTEKKRIIYLQPLRYLAAAIFIGACAVGVWMWQKPYSKIINVADVNSTQHQPTKQNDVVVKPADSVKQQIQQPQSQQNTIAQQPVINKEEKAVTKPSVVKKKTDIIKQKEIVVAEHHLSTQQEKKTHEPIDENNIARQQKPVINKNEIAINIVKPDPADLIEKPVTAKQQEKNNDASTTNTNNYKTYDVAYKEINPDDESNSLHVGILDLNKNKVKNLFKKAGRLFGKAKDNSNDDGKLQVANFTIQTIKQ